MRSEKQMLDLILDTARRDERIRAVLMNGSRANPAALADFFQDYDIVYFVTEVAPFRHNLDWIGRFGELMVMQLPDEMGEPAPGGAAGFMYLMQFTDGNRVDLGIYPLSDAAGRTRDSLSRLLLDKDGVIGPLAPASERDYLPVPPTAKDFADCCGEFWWVCPYVAKGLWRDEFLYARYMLDQVIREQLLKMLAWHLGIQTHFACNLGKHGKYFQRYLESAWWEMLRKTYAEAGMAQTWDALFAMCDLFRLAADCVAAHFGYDYPLGDDRRVTAHLQHVSRLPRDATTLY
jgi:aminoglycoside 6-adenylyltransferase